MFVTSFAEIHLPTKGHRTEILSDVEGLKRDTSGEINTDNFT